MTRIEKRTLTGEGEVIRRKLKCLKWKEVYGRKQVSAEMGYKLGNVLVGPYTHGTVVCL